MKKLTTLVLASTLSLALTSTGTLAATTPKGQNVCDFERTLLASNGFTSSAAYTRESLLTLFSAIKVDAGDLSELDPSEHYNATFSCKAVNNLGRSQFVLTPVNQVPGSKTVTVKWKFTKPFGANS